MNSGFQSALAHAQDPFNNPAPNIEVPPSSIAASIVVHPSELPKKKPNRVRRVAAAAAVLLLLLLACPVAASGVMEMMDNAAKPAEGSGLSPEDMSGPQLTALAGTIEALSTELAGAGGDETQSPEQIQTAVMATLASDGDFEILGMLEGTPTPAQSATPGPSPTATKTFTPGPSPTPSRTPTKTKTPTVGPSPTPSKTPTPSRTPTITYTPSPGPSPTGTWTPIASKTPTPSATPFSSSTPPSPSPTFDPTGTTTAMITPPPTVITDPCDGIKFTSLGIDVGGTIVWGYIYNGSPQRIEIQEIYLVWPEFNGFHYKFDLAGDPIWDIGNSLPPTITGPLFMDDRKIDSGETKKLVGVFDTVEPGFYHLGVSFMNDGCWIEGWP